MLIEAESVSNKYNFISDPSLGKIRYICTCNCITIVVGVGIEVALKNYEMLLKVYVVDTSSVVGHSQGLLGTLNKDKSDDLTDAYNEIVFAENPSQIDINKFADSCKI